MPHYIIFPRYTAGAMLQYSCEARDAGAAFAAFAELAGEQADIDAFSIAEVTGEQRTEVDEWDQRGAPAWDAPVWLDRAIETA